MALACACAWACSRKAEPPPPPEMPVREIALQPSKPPVRQTYKVTGGDAARAAEVVRARLVRLVPGDRARVSADGDRLVVDLPATDVASLERLQAVIAAPGAVAVHEVALSSDVMGPLLDHVVSDARAVESGIGVDHERWQGPEGTPPREDRFLLANDRRVLEQYVSDTTAADASLGIAAGTELRYHSIPTTPPRWRTYAVVATAAIDSSSVRRAAVRQMPTGDIVVELALHDDGKRAFAELTRRLIGRKLAIVIDGAISSAPVVMDEIPGGRLYVGVAHGTGDPRDTAEDLAVTLGSGALPGALQLESAALVTE